MSVSLKIFLLYASIMQLVLSPFALLDKSNVFALLLSILIIAISYSCFILFSKKNSSIIKANEDNTQFSLSQEYKIFLLIQSYYLLPIVITLSLVKELSFITKTLWLIFANISAFICFLELPKQKNYLLLLAASFVSLCLMMIFHYFNLSTQSLILSCLVFNFAMLKEKYHIISKQLLRFVVLLLILRLSFIFSGNFVYKNQIFLLVYVATCTFFALRLKDKKNQNINLLLYLFFSSLIPLQVSFSDALSCLISSLSLMLGIKSPVLFSIKSKYGNLKVVKFLLHRCNALFHNDTIHGIQYFDKQNFSYYHKDSHIGKFLTAFITPEKKLNIGVVGLGIGELSLYAHNKNQKISFYEIDEELIKIVTNPNYFSIIKESKADINIISGEARKVMQKESEQQYDVLIIDAYSGHTIPNYLLSYEALKLYSKKIKSNGILILHATGSSFSDNEMAKIIQELNLTAYISHYELQEKNEQKPTQHQGLHYVKTCEHTLWDKINKRLNELLKICGLTLMNMDNFASDWVIIAHDKVDLSLVAKDRSWISLKNNSSQTMLMTDMAIGYRNF